jgi:hypothetical protein
VCSNTRPITSFICTQPRCRENVIWGGGLEANICIRITETLAFGQVGGGGSYRLISQASSRKRRSGLLEGRLQTPMFEQVKRHWRSFRKGFSGWVGGACLNSPLFQPPPSKC